jgi:Lon protease-like protein
MFKEVLESQKPKFGYIVSHKNSQLETDYVGEHIGTIAEVLEHKKDKEGKIAIKVLGKDKFKINFVNRTPYGYFEGFYFFIYLLFSFFLFFFLFFFFYFFLLFFLFLFFFFFFN